MKFGLNVAPAIMKATVDAALSKNKSIKRATTAYIAKYIDKNLISEDYMKWHLSNFGLNCKNPEWLWNSVCILGLQIKAGEQFS